MVWLGGAGWQVWGCCLLKAYLRLEDTLPKAYSLDWQVGAGRWQEASVPPLVSSSRGLLSIFPTWWLACLKAANQRGEVKIQHSL